MHIAFVPICAGVNELLSQIAPPPLITTNQPGWSKERDRLLSDRGGGGRYRHRAHRAHTVPAPSVHLQPSLSFSSVSLASLEEVITVIAGGLGWERQWLESWGIKKPF